MATKYVSSGGNNGNSGDGPGAGDAYASLQFAVDAVTAIGAGPHTVYLGAGVAEANTLITLDSTNDGVTITIDGEDAGSIGNNSATQTIYCDNTYGSGTVNFQNLTLAHVDSGNSWAIRLGEDTAAGDNATDVNLNFTNCTLSSSHHLMWSRRAGVYNVTFTNCTLTYGSTGYILTGNNTGAVAYSGCTINSDNGGADLVLASGGDLSGGLTITNCEVSGKDGAEYSGSTELAPTGCFSG